MPRFAAYSGAYGNAGICHTFTGYTAETPKLHELLTPRTGYCCLPLISEHDFHILPASSGGGGGPAVLHRQHTYRICSPTGTENGAGLRAIKTCAVSLCRADAALRRYGCITGDIVQRRRNAASGVMIAVRRIAMQRLGLWHDERKRSLLSVRWLRPASQQWVPVGELHLLMSASSYGRLRVHVAEDSPANHVHSHFR